MRPLDFPRPTVLPPKPAAPAPTAAPPRPAAPTANVVTARPPPRADGFDGRGGSRLSASVELQPPPPPPPPAPEPEKKKEKGFLDKMKGGARELYGDIKDVAGDVKNAAIEVKDTALEVGGKVVDEVTGLGRDWMEALDYEGQIDKLGPGDTYKLSLGGDASIEGFKGYAKGNLEVSRNDEGEYIVSADGELGGGLYAQLGGSAGGRASAEGELTGGIKGKVELKFTSPEEAKRAADILVRMAAPEVAMLKGGPPSVDDMKFVTKNLSAVEVSQNQALQLGVDLGLGVKQSSGASAFVEGGVKVEYTARIEFDDKGKPSLVVKSDMSGEVTGGLEFGVNNSKNVTAGTQSSLQATGALKGTLTTESRFDIPLGVDPLKLVQDPVGTLKGAAVKELKSVETKTTVTVQAEGTAGKKGGGYEAKLSVTTGPGKFLEGPALDYALRGQLDKAAEAAGASAEVEASIHRYDKTGVAASPELKFVGIGAGAEISAERTDYDTAPVFSFKGNGAQAAGAFRDWTRGDKKLSDLNQQVATGRYLGGVRA